MRLSDVLSDPPTLDFKQVEGFLNEKILATGKQRKVQEGIVGLNFFCKRCNSIRTFHSGEELYCIGVNEHLLSLDCVLSCRCGASVQVWFLIDCKGQISGHAPEIRILKRSEKLSPDVALAMDRYGDLSELLEKAEQAHRDRLGAGAIVYLRKIYELVTMQTAEASDIPLNNANGTRRPFKRLLEDVDRKCSIIPSEFTANSYTLFGELSDIIHGAYNEELALIKYESLYRLIIGILEGVKNHSELLIAVDSLGWNDRGDDGE